jgi:methionyl-tRNA synthetase
MLKLPAFIMLNAMDKILVTSALPYANGEIHLGHLVEYIQTDIWVRFLKQQGNECYYICSDDAHGTPIMLKAEELGITPEQLISEVKTRHEKDFADFSIAFDNYHSTHSPENQELASTIYTCLFDKGYIKEHTISQAYDEEKQMFLPDRFIKGECPKCGAKDQYGDNCEKCSATYSPLDLKNPYSVVSNTTPSTRDSLHYFFDLPQFEDKLKDWCANHIPRQMKNKLDEWFESGLKMWDISRDAPYFGFQIPNTENKYFYVWLDAPIGYIASFKNYCDNNNVDFDKFWNKDSDTKLYHFIGKDIMYFHALFWPAMLMGSDMRLPSEIFTHGFLTVNGEKMSKSRGTFITARKYLEHLNPEALRYYYAYKLSDKTEDIDLNLADFKQRFNSDIVGKVVNIASRTAGFIVKKFDKTLSAFVPQNQIYENFVAKDEVIKELYEQRKYSQAMREVMALADIANEYIAEKEPWVLIKEDNNKAAVHDIASLSINLFRIIITYLSPVMPELAQKSAEFLNLEELSWKDIKHPLTKHQINKFKPLAQRIEDDSLKNLTI